jgi:hypothetical protein
MLLTVRMTGSETTIQGTRREWLGILASFPPAPPAIDRPVFARIQEAVMAAFASYPRDARSLRVTLQALDADRVLGRRASPQPRIQVP